MTPVSTAAVRTPIKEADAEVLRSIIKTASQIITSDEACFQQLKPYASHLIRISLGELRRNERALKAASANTKSSKK